MTEVTSNQPEGTPTWIELEVPDHERAQEFYRTLFGWEYDGTTCLLRGLPVAAIKPGAEAIGWTMYFATEDCDTSAKRITDAGGSLITAPTDVTNQGRAAVAVDPVGARFGLWQGREHLGCRLVNEPGSLLRNDLVTAAAEPARAFYTAVFDYTLDGNEDLPGLDFTFLRLPDGHEIGGIFGQADAPSSIWTTLFEVDSTDAVVKRAIAAGGTSTVPEDTLYGRMATITDPFGTEFSVGARLVVSS
jgi:predicted enzyme related to lactoylglutathione lyase